MCKTIARLLDIPEEKLATSIKKLEQAAGYPSQDVRLTAEIVGKVYQATKALGLDPLDTTAAELYHALVNLAQKHDIFLVKRIGAQASDDTTDLAKRMVHVMQKLKASKEVWAVKPTAFKRILRQQVPRRAMKQLGYRSLDSLLKREPMNRLIALLPLLESQRWYGLFVERYQQLTPADFEQRHVEVIIIEGPKWREILEASNNHEILMVNRESGSIVLLPELVSKREGYCLTTLPMLLQHLANLRLHSAYLKLMQTRPNFGQLVADSVTGHTDTQVNIAEHDIGWSAIHKHLARQADIPELFEPHVTSEDLLLYRAEEVLYHLEPALHFWHDMEYVGVHRDGQTVSFNILDIAQSLAAHTQFGKQQTTYLKENLSDQLLLRYLAMPHLETRVFAQLDYQAFDPELLALAQVEDF